MVGGLLVQDRDADVEERGDMQVVTERRPTEAEWQELSFAWKVCKHVNSNAIVITRDLATIGIGAGQMSRVDSVRLALEKARDGVDGRRAGLRRLLPVRRRPRAGDRGGRHRDHPAGRLDPRPLTSSRPSTPPASRWSSPAAGTSGIDRPPAVEPSRLAGDPPSPWEGQFGFSRVVRAGGFVLVGGTTSVDPERRVLGRDRIRADVEILEQARARARARRRQPGRRDLQTRVYVTDISRADEVGRAHGERLRRAPAADDDGRGLGPDRPADAGRDRDGRLHRLDGGSSTGGVP